VNQLLVITLVMAAACVGSPALQGATFRGVPAPPPAQLRVSTHSPSSPLQPPDTASRSFALELAIGSAVGELASAASGVAGSPGFSGQLLATLPLGRSAGGEVDVYGGWAWTGFGCEDGFCRDASVRYRSQGPRAGIQWTRGVVRLRAGAIAERLTSTWTVAPPGEGRADAATGYGAGIEASAGVAWRPGRWKAHDFRSRILLVPGIRYARYQASFPGSEKDRVTHIAIDLGVRLESPFRD
jgi:hypothetical protein